MVQFSNTLLFCIKRQNYKQYPIPIFFSKEKLLFLYFIILEDYFFYFCRKILSMCKRIIFQNFDNLLTLEEIIDQNEVQWETYHRLGFTSVEIVKIIFENPFYKNYFINEECFESVKEFFLENIKNRC
jgi:hypothetical protein